ncbi:hypothetical protein WMY93_029231 [Mugilogobius chulae]|uniref:Claudin-3 n=1 Tax=Mugilogobius chulae TaxID=88201 RepID=A0AAW0MQL4_9GOBI
MPSAGLEILGVTLAVLGWISAIVSCALPMWRVSAFIGVNIVTAQMTWEGIWMNCVVQSTGQMQCKVHDSMLALSGDLQAARALTVIAIVLGIVGMMVSIMGAKCTNCVDEDAAKAKVMIAAGVCFIIASLMELIPVSWSAHTIIMEFYNPVIPEAQKREIGAALYLGWAATAFLLIGGIILCSSCPPQTEKRYGPPSKVVYSQSRSVAPSYPERRDYVHSAEQWACFMIQGDWVISSRSQSAEGEVSREMASSLRKFKGILQTDWLIKGYQSTQQVLPPVMKSAAASSSSAPALPYKLDTVVQATSLSQV